MKIDKVKKLNVGSGWKRMPGFVNLDVLEWDGNTDIVQDLSDIPWPFESGQIEEIVCCEVLEHVGFRVLPEILNEMYRVMDKGGRLHVQVPDCGRMMEYYVDKKICRCVPHKDAGDGFHPDPACPDCGGKAIINPVRWQMAFTGAQKHGFDTHKNVFTRESLEEALRTARFHRFEYEEHIYKIKVNCWK